ncbi:DUF882 domain-containing protein [Sorangium sp. So ce315]|uniref:YcbK family protein n=1 Tax=Sorangium sp. So ce315 TaxID=3133299 RepID=UPI003F62C62C
MMSLRSVSSAGAAPRAAGEPMRSAEPRARLTRARAAVLSVLVSMAVPAVPAGPLHAEPLPRAHAAEKTGEEARGAASEQARRERPPASVGGERAERARGTEGGKAAGKETRKAARKEPRKEARKEPRKAAGKEPRKAAGKEARKEARKEAGKEPRSRSLHGDAGAASAAGAGGDEKTGGAEKRKGPSRGKATRAANAEAGKEAGARKAAREKRKEKRTAARTVESKRRTAKKKEGSREKGGREAPPKPCLGPTLSIDRSGLEPERLELVDCAGRPREEARRALSLLARPWGTPRPVLPDERASNEKARKPEASGKRRSAGDRAGAAGSKRGREQAGEIAPGVRLLDPGLLTRIDALARQYPGRLVSLVSGYRPQSQGSLHQTGRALDLRIAGVRNDALAAACRKLADTGCGYYPNSSFVHIDVRAPGTGSVSWIDASGPGEAPRYVTAWPPPQPQEEQRAATEAVSGEDTEEVLRRERREKPVIAAASAVPEMAASAGLEKVASAVPETAASVALEPEKAAGEVPDKAAGAAPDKAAGAAPEKAAGAAPEKAAGAAPEKAAGAAPEKAAGAAPEKAAGAAPEKAASGAPARGTL